MARATAGRAGAGPLRHDAGAETLHRGVVAAFGRNTCLDQEFVTKRRIGVRRSGRIVLRLSRNIQKVAEARFGRADGQVLHGSPPAGPVIFLESGLRFEADVLRGQKTGFFLDQRENRRWVETLARGREVLNAFSFSGGFSLYAARGGAQSVTDLDISAHALAAAKRNFQLNQSDPAVARCAASHCAGGHVRLAGGKARRGNSTWWFWTRPRSPNASRNAPGPSARMAGWRRWGLPPCARTEFWWRRPVPRTSARMNFFTAVRDSAAKSGRKFTELQTTRHAPDHPAGFKEMEYLKAIYLKFA